MTLKGIRIAWLREQDWPRWLELDPDFQPDYQHRLRRMRDAEARLATADIPHVRVLVTPDEFKRWADARGKDYSTVSRGIRGTPDDASRHSMNKHNLYDRRWRRRREQQLRNEPLCRLCKQMRGIVTAATVADHITPHRGDLELFEGPLQSLCKECHDSWKQQQETTGHIRGCDLSGVPIDPSHPWNQERSR